MEIKSSVPAGNLSQQDKFLKSLRSFSTIVRRTTISTTTILRKTLTKVPAAFFGNFSPVDGGGGGGGGGGKKEEKENSSCPTPPLRPPKPHPGQKVRCGNSKQEERKCQPSTILTISNTSRPGARNPTGCAETCSSCTSSSPPSTSSSPAGQKKKTSPLDPA